MILSCDLDGTLIFTRRWLEPSLPVVAAEHRLGEPFSYMTPNALELLRLLAKQTLFVVNTLRGAEQARRVEFVAVGSCPYLCTQNGLTIYQAGHELPEWTRWVESTVADLPQSLQTGVALVLRELRGIQCLSKQYPHLAVFFVEPEEFDQQAYKDLQKELAAVGWELYRQRKKLYLSPLEIDKGEALAWIMEREGENAVGFGDSYFDLPMLRRCRFRYSLKDSELWNTKKENDICFSSKPTAAGTEEILCRILQQCQELKEC